MLFRKTFFSIINDNDIINYSDKFISSFEVSKWAEWHKEFLEDEEKHKADGHNFNIFYLLRDEFGFHVQETMHSKLIKFLLDSHASHGQGNKFLVKFLELMKIENPTEGIWDITAEQGKIDILLKREFPESIIIIENKSNWAGDQPNQLYRYWYEAVYSRTKQTGNDDFYLKNKSRYKIIYLAPNSYKAPTEQSMSKPVNLKDNNLPDKIPKGIIEPRTYDNDIQKWLDDCKKCLPETNQRIKEYISQYQMLCKIL